MRHDSKSLTDKTYEQMLKDRNIDKPAKKGYNYSKIRVKNSEDWHKFEFRKRGKDDSTEI